MVEGVKGFHAILSWLSPFACAPQNDMKKDVILRL